MLIIMLKIYSLFSTLLENLNNFFTFTIKNFKQKYFIAYVYY